MIPYLQPLLYEELIRKELKDDMGAGGDITSLWSIPPEKTMKAGLTAREEGCLSGLLPGLSAFSFLNRQVKITRNAEDGDMIQPGQVLAVIEGPSRDILTAERTCLNIISHLSGIATAAARMVEAVSGTGARIADTRKTLPGLRALQKYAVRCGGGVNHRFSLDSAVLIKDNHLSNFGSWEEGIRVMRKAAGPGVQIEIEIDTLDQLQRILNLPVDAVLLDNMDCETLREAVRLTAGRFITEASGKVTPENVREIAQTGVDFISCGALTHSSRSLDIGLDV